MNRERRHLCLIAAVLLLLPAIALGQPRPTSLPSTSSSESSKFLRFVDDAHGGGRLEASVVTYRNAKGQTVDLIAAVHIADAGFYHDLDQSFRSYDSLLYEMVKP